ncbi:MAG: radical SAM protein [Lachnospiraceae bacterium]|nr:radical SAM protein [Lachnospiraceae bacterium]
MNIYTKNLNRIEFLMTLACTGKCKHCSEGTHDASGTFIERDAAVDAVRKVAGQYKMKSLMTFGGEPLLQWESVCSIHAAARDAGISQRQLITNGYFTKDSEKIGFVVRELRKSGVNAILLSVDAFHQETIPLEVVKEFGSAAKRENIYVRTHPAWLGDEKADNPYNQETRKILGEFDLMGIAASEGNIIFPAGNALNYLKEYFDSENVVANPYVEDPRDIRSICIGPEGNVLGDNIYQKDILEILSDYVPE